MKTKSVDFKKLTPRDDIELGSRKDALDYVFNEDDINNIAISGAYGSGKSSLIETYKKSDNNNKYLTVSLAHFENAENSENIESVLERKIINQLVHKVPAEKIPLTNFKLKTNTKISSLVFYCLLIVILIITTSHLLLFDKWVLYINYLYPLWLRKAFYLTIQPWSPIVSAILSLVIIALGIFEIIKIEKNRNVFKSLRLKDAEIELYNDDDNESYFDKYLNDILYIFDSCEENAFVFEDLDRFDSVLIFERLREINNLVNEKIKKHNSNSNNQKKTVKFFYLLRDDIFVSKDRTKFFDFIIPVIPVIDGSNSYEKIREFFLVTEEDKSNFEEQFLSDLSLYIDDMRLLENIYNEFHIYKNELKDTKPDYNKLLALIVYKNIFPKDFSDLQLNRSYINAVFSKRHELYKDNINEISKQIADLKNDLIDAENEIAKDLNELEDIYNAKKSKNRSYPYYQQLTPEQKEEYDKRKEVVSSSHGKNSIEKQIKQKINELEIAKEELKVCKFKDLITPSNQDTVFKAVYKNELGEITNYNGVKGNEYFSLVKYLIRYGYIDENYSDYMTYFYSDSITLQDKIFVKSVVEQTPNEFSYRLNNPETVIKRIRVVDFKEKATLNYDLAFFILNNSLYNAQLFNLLWQIKDTEEFGFIEGYLKYGASPELFVKRMNAYWPECFECAVDNEKDDTLLIPYSQLTLYSFDEKVLDEINRNRYLTDYISVKEDYLNDINIESDFVTSLEYIGVKFEKIDISDLNKHIVNEVYKKHLYVINKANIVMVNKWFLGETNYDNIIHESYTIAYKNRDSAFYQYISKNINDYISVVLDICEGEINDEEQAVIELINNEELTEDNKASYVSLLKTQINSLINVNKYEDKAIIVEHGNINHSLENILALIAESLELDNTQVDFINEFESLDFTSIELTDEERKRFFELIIDCNEIDDELYRGIVSNYGCAIEVFNYESIDANKMSILIENDIIIMNTNNLVFVRENYANIKYIFIKKYIDLYIEIMNASSFKQDELVEILSWEIDFTYKEALLSLCKEDVDVINSGYSDDVDLYIIENGMYSNNDIELIRNYDDFYDNSQKIIQSIAQSHIKRIKLESGLSLELLFYLISTNNNADGMDLLLKNFDRFKKSQLKNLLIALDCEKFNEVFDKSKRPHFEVNSRNENLLTAFKNSRYIYDYTDNGNFYTIRRDPPRPKKLYKIK
ncbi:MAG: hypothetical protein IJ731_01855 [Eubacterium sp.]|nr:hypothetical protein [Eubacterium sp.]